MVLSPEAANVIAVRVRNVPIALTLSVSAGLSPSNLTLPIEPGSDGIDVASLGCRLVEPIFHCNPFTDRAKHIDLLLGSDLIGFHAREQFSRERIHRRN